MLSAGIPRWNLGEHVIEPIVTIGFLLAFFFLGFRGILFGLVLFVLHKLSTRPGGLGGLLQSFTGGNPTNPNQRNRGPSRGNGGNRLGGQGLGNRRR
jgi:hypothetical protein